MGTRLRRILLTSVAALVAGLVAATSALSVAQAPAQSSAGPNQVQKKLTKIGFVVMGLGGGQWKALSEVVKKEARKYGIEVLVADPEYDGVKQVDQAENLVVAGAQVLIVAALDSKGITKAVDFAHKRGVPVVAAEVKFAGADALVTYRECGWGDIVGAYAGKWWRAYRKGIKALYWEANADSFGGDVPKRTDCMISAFKRYIPDAGSAANIEAWLEEKGFNVMQDVRTAHPDLNVVFGSDNEVLYGAISALEAAGGVAGKDVIFMSVASSPRVLELIRDGKVLAVSSLPTTLEGTLLVKVARQVHEGTYKKGSTTYFNTDLINFSNVDDYIAP